MMQNTILLLLCITVAVHSVRHVAYIDHNNQSPAWLFRGGTPNVGPNQSFDWCNLTSTIRHAGRSVGITLPKQFYLVDISLERTYGNDEQHTISEWKYFNTNPHKGEFHFWETMGTDDSATDHRLPIEMRDWLAKYFNVWDRDQINRRMEQLHSMLFSLHSKPTVYYMHCECGCDRTGEMSAAYYMRWLNYTLAEANALDTKIAERPMHLPNYRAAQWYSQWLAM